MVDKDVLPLTTLLLHHSPKIMFPSEPGSFFFINRILTWMKRQRKRLWCMTPFWDSVGEAMINSCEANDIRIICRQGHADKYLREGIPLRFNHDLHTKMIVGDRATLMGSFNMTYQSMFDNLEQATFSRSRGYAELFESEWERLSSAAQSEV